MKANTFLRFAGIAALAFAASASAQQFVYPAKGQSAEQQRKDEAECHTWAVGQTGVDPTKAAPAPKPATTPTGVAPGAGVRGAARGAVVGEVVGGDAGAGAAAGAAAARAQSRRQNAAQQQQAQGQQQAQSSAYTKARAACLEGRGYSVK
ncbi:MAG TPA: hypothetical protein VFX05_00205 [Casimicrobiaceae bacterium]|nr:hypothetical protein [Casimicrobiaceae bacterium]